MFIIYQPSVVFIQQCEQYFICYKQKFNSYLGIGLCTQGLCCWWISMSYQLRIIDIQHHLLCQYHKWASQGSITKSYMSIYHCQLRNTCQANRLCQTPYDNHSYLNLRNLIVVVDVSAVYMTASSATPNLYSIWRFLLLYCSGRYRATAAVSVGSFIRAL